MRKYARRTRADARTSIGVAAPALLGRPEVTLAKILDEYAYVAITLNGG